MLLNFSKLISHNTFPSPAFKVQEISTNNLSLFQCQNLSDPFCLVFEVAYWSSLFAWQIKNTYVIKVGDICSNFNILFKYKVFKTKRVMSEACLISFLFVLLAFGWHNWSMFKKNTQTYTTCCIVPMYLGEKIYTQYDTIKYK